MELDVLNECVNRCLLQNCSKESVVHTGPIAFYFYLMVTKRQICTGIDGPGCEVVVLWLFSWPDFCGTGVGSSVSVYGSFVKCTVRNGRSYSVVVNRKRSVLMVIRNRVL